MPGDGDNSITITAPGGMLIVQTCVKAGSSMSGGGAVYQSYEPGVESTTLYGPAGKTISHWSAQYAPKSLYTGEATVSGSQDICTADDETVTISYTSGPVTRTSTESQAAADAAAQAAAQAAADADLAAQLEGYPGYTPGACQGTTEYTSTKTVSGSQDICTADDETVTISYTSGPVTRTSTESQAAADAAAQAAAQAAADADLAAQLEDYPGHKKGSCQDTTVYTGTATVSDTVQICTTAGSTVTISYTSGPVTRTSTESQEAADAAALAAAQEAAEADLAEQLTAYPGYTTGACAPPTSPPPTTPPSTPAASAPASVAPVLPATVETATPTPTPTPTEVAVPLPATVEEPETVSVPMPATVPVPTSVPAGDGSSAQQSSLVPLGLLVAGLIGLLGSAVARVRRQSR